ncbi:MAG: leucine--tRNA ligase, partial [Chloroflexi bacterium]
FNTAVSSLMTLRNDLKMFIKDGKLGVDAWRNAMNVMLRLMAPITPHIAEELWAHLGWDYSVHTQEWPQFDPEKAKENSVSLVIMINGKPRGEIMVQPDIDEEAAIKLALASQEAQRYINGKQPKKVIFIPARKGQEPKVNIVL